MNTRCSWTPSPRSYIRHTSSKVPFPFKCNIELRYWYCIGVDIKCLHIALLYGNFVWVMHVISVCLKEGKPKFNDRMILSGIWHCPYTNDYMISWLSFSVIKKGTVFPRINTKFFMSLSSNDLDWLYLFLWRFLLLFLWKFEILFHIESLEDMNSNWTYVIN